MSLGDSFVVVYLPSLCKALSSNPRTTKNSHNYTKLYNVSNRIVKPIAMAKYSQNVKNILMMDKSINYLFSHIITQLFGQNKLIIIYSKKCKVISFY